MKTLNTIKCYGIAKVIYRDLLSKNNYLSVPQILFVWNVLHTLPPYLLPQTLFA